MACPFGDGDFPGWRVVVEAFYAPAPARTYGALTYGSDVYGDPAGATARWVDITEPSFAVDVLAGSSDAGAVVPVSEFTISFRDDEGDWWDFAPDEARNLPGVGAPLRFGLLDPADTYWPLGTGHVESIEDEHDTPPRVVTITAYGNLSWLVTSVGGWQAPAQTAETRIAALIAAGGGPPSYSIEGATYPPLIADAEPTTIVVRDELDRTALSAGWYLSEDAWGLLRFRLWPHHPVGPTLVVSDCPADGERLAHRITYRADTAALLNVAVAANAAEPPVTVTSTDEPSVATYGRRSEGVGYPMTGLAFVDAAAGLALASAARSRYARIVNRAEAFDADTSADRGWLEVLAGLDIGRYVQIVRRGVTFYFLEAVVIGYALHLERNRMTASVYVSTITPTG